MWVSDLSAYAGLGAERLSFGSGGFGSEFTPGHDKWKWKDSGGIWVVYDLVDAQKTDRLLNSEIELGARGKISHDGLDLGSLLSCVWYI